MGNTIKKKIDSMIWQYKPLQDNILDIQKRNIREIFNVFDDGTNQEDKNNYWLKIEYVQKCLDVLLRDGKISDWWFLYARSKWEENGSHKFDVVEQSASYEKNITEKEKNLYKRKDLISNIWPYFHSDKIKNLIELWPWAGGKFLSYRRESDPHFQAFKKNYSENNKNYYAMDISAQSIQDTSENFDKFWVTMWWWVVWDFFGEWELPRNIDNQWYVFLWWSIGNFDKKKIIELLKRMAPNSRLSSVPALITYFSAPDKLNLDTEEYQNKILELKAAYGDSDTNNPYYSIETHHAINDFIMWGFKALWIPTENLELVVEYQESVSPGFPASIKVWAKILQSFDIREWYRTYTGHKWHNLRAIQSQRFSEQDWQIILKESDFRLKKNFDNDGVSAMLIQSKIWYNSSFKIERNYIISLALVSLLSSWLLFTKSMVQDKKVHQKIQTHKNKLAQNHSMRWIENDANIYNQAWDLMKEFITLYGKWWLSENEIQDDIYKFLSESSSWPDWMNKFSSSIWDNFVKDQFLYHFVNNSFYEKMLKNWFETLDPMPFLKWLEKDFIETLKYDWPIREWYNEKTNTYAIVHAPSLVRTSDIKWLEDEDLISWYMLEHKWHISTIKVSEGWYKQSFNGSNDVIVISESEPDENGYITVKRFIINEYNADNIVNRIKSETKKIIFIDTHDKKEITLHTNLMVHKETIVNFFEKNNSTFSKACKLLDQLAWFQQHFVGSDRYYSEVKKLKRLLLISLYEEGPLWNSRLTRIWYDYNEQMLMEFVWMFVNQHKDTIDEIKKSR